MSSKLHQPKCPYVAGSPADDDHEEAGPSEAPPATQQRSARPKSTYTLAGFVGYWASFFVAADVGRPSSAKLKGRQPGRDGARVVNCTLDTATGMHLTCKGACPASCSQAIQHTLFFCFCR